jgi:hypothetical protein
MTRTCFVVLVTPHIITEAIIELISEMFMVFFHHLKRPYVLNSDVQPDIYDPNCHCKACNISLSSKANYRGHLQSVHGFGYMKHIKDLDVKNDLNVPDTDCLDFSCRACENKNSPIDLHTYGIFANITRLI